MIDKNLPDDFWETIDGMTVNERLYHSGLMEEFYQSLKSNKARVREILEFLRVNEYSIGRILEKG